MVRLGFNTNFLSFNVQLDGKPSYSHHKALSFSSLDTFKNQILSYVFIFIISLLYLTPTINVGPTYCAAVLSTQCPGLINSYVMVALERNESTLVLYGIREPIIHPFYAWKPPWCHKKSVKGMGDILSNQSKASPELDQWKWRTPCLAQPKPQLTIPIWE